MKRVLVVLVMVGCGDDGGGNGGAPVSTDEARELCDAFGAHATSCGWGGNVNQYDWNCGEAALVWRDDAMRTFSTCATQLACLGDGMSCLTSTSSAIQPLDFHLAYSTKCEAKFAECGMTATLCGVEAWKLYTRAIVDDLSACMESPCADVQTCISTVL
jgi:hypothetical protein